MNWNTIDGQTVKQDWWTVLQTFDDALNIIDQYKYLARSPRETSAEPVQQRLDTYVADAREMRDRYTPALKVTVPRYHRDYRRQVEITETVAEIHNTVAYLEQIAEAFPDLEDAADANGQ